MKATFLTMVLAFMAGLSAAEAKTICIKSQDIQNSVPDKTGSAITFTMKDGKVWRNDLQARCPDLQFEGFAWTLHGTDEVCDDQQVIRVINSPEICALGNFKDITPAEPKR